MARGQRTRTSPWLIRLFILLLAVGAVVYVVAGRLFWQPKVTEEAFWTAWRADDRARVVEIYELARRELETAEADSLRLAVSQEVFTLIEQTTADHTRDLFATVTEGATLGEKELGWLHDYRSLTAQTALDVFLDYAYEYLAGGHSDEGMRQVLEQWLQVDAVYATYAQVGLEYARMVASRPAIAEAETAMRQAEWRSAVALWTDLLEDAETSHFTRGFVEVRKKTAEESLRGETVRTVAHFLAQKKYYSARETLGDILTIYPFDEQLLSLHAEVESHLPRHFVTWDWAVEHLAVRPLIAHPEIAFDGDNLETAADYYLLLASEFERLLKSLYDNDYVLVSPDSFITDDGEFVPFRVPEGKSPLVLVLDSFHFSPSRIASGTVSCLALDEEGQVVGADRTDEGELVLRPGLDAVSLLEAFLVDYPDFSFDGAKGTIALTGQHGLFGYVLDEDQAWQVNEGRVRNGLLPLAFEEADFTANQATVRELAQKLRDTGWLLAANTYGDFWLPDASLEQMEDDDRLWKKRVAPLLGKTSIFVYPGGQHVNTVQEKTALLVEQGYHQLLGYGDRAYFAYGEGYVHIDMTLIGGDALRRPELYGSERFFSPDQVYDWQRRP